ncbi:MAG: redoxin domain-containing protein [Candidatus Rokubacteria bacterium]|nr:redoxin domain-containing protein [Candidatus Rokubacteria bacterium]
MEALPIGTKAPHFSLHATPDQEVRLDDFRGRRLVLAFYPADWSPVCGDQMALYSELTSEFRRHNAEILGISVDGTWCHMAYRQHRKIGFALLADFEPKGAVARAYGAYDDAHGTAARVLFVLDESGVVRWNHVSPLGVNPGADGILTALETLDGERAA